MSRSRLGYVSSTNTGTIVSSGVPYGIATGGNSSASITDTVAYTLLTFTTDGTITVTTAGLFDLAVFGAGGSGGSGGASSRGGGGGGAGSFNLGTFYLEATTYAVTIGVGGVAVNDSDGIPGTQSLIAGIIAGYGGFGGGFQSPTGGNVKTRGCGGGGSTNVLTWYPNTSEFRAFAGGVGANDGAGGGGGGVAAVGAAASGNTGGAGGAGYNIGSFVGAGSLFKNGGGGGGGTTAGGAGGSSVGGAGGGSAAAGSAAGANTGSGGGGAQGSGGGGGSFGKGGNGGSGIVYVRFKV